MPRITHQGQVRELTAGGRVTFGRAADRDLRLGHDPVDPLISRHAGEFVSGSEGVLVTNASTKRPLLVQVVPGPEYTVHPQMTLGLNPFDRVRVIVVGQHGARHAIDVDLSGRNHAGIGTSGRPAAGPITTIGYERLETLTRRERRYLAALCEPLLRRVGAGAQAATYTEIATRCGASPRTVRNALDDLRFRLSSELGLADLVADPDGGSGSQAQPGRITFLPALARWAVDSGNITVTDLEMLDEPRG